MKFEKVSRQQFINDFRSDCIVKGRSTIKIVDYLPNVDEKEIYDNINLPRRGSAKSAGYDFVSPYGFLLNPGETIKISTGIRVLLDDDKFLLCAPRSGQGFKFRLQLNNTVGIIDSDYSESDNEGHILFKITNDTNEGKTLKINAGDKFVQGVILSYYRVEDDDVIDQRNGGFGSTDK